MSEKAAGHLFSDASAYGDNVLALPVSDIDAAAAWYATTFGMTEVSRSADPVPTAILERDGVRIGLAENGGDSTQDGAAILVTDIDRAQKEIEANGGAVGNRRVDSRDDGEFDVFFVIAPDGLCYYFHQPVDAPGSTG